MKTLIAMILLITGCSNTRPVFKMYGESDYFYTRIGVIWGPDVDGFETEIEDMIDGDSGGGGGSCGSGSCSDK